MSPVVDERKKFELGDYVEVKDRLRILYELYPQARLVTTHVSTEMGPDGTPRVLVEAAAYRTPDDPLPARGWSWMALPGTTPYTRGSELENTETSAWGRAIAALGILVDRSIASAQEVANKQDGAPPTSRPATSDGGLVGTVEIGNAPSDYQLREDATKGPAISFRLVEGRQKMKVIAFGDLAASLDVLRADVLGKRVTAWGSMGTESFPKNGKNITYPVLTLSRLQTPDLTLPAPVGLLTPEDQAELDAIAI